MARGGGEVVEGARGAEVRNYGGLRYAVRAGVVALGVLALPACTTTAARVASGGAQVAGAALMVGAKVGGAVVETGTKVGVQLVAASAETGAEVVYAAGKVAVRGTVFVVQNPERAMAVARAAAAAMGVPLPEGYVAAVRFFERYERVAEVASRVQEAARIAALMQQRAETRGEIGGGEREVVVAGVSRFGGEGEAPVVVAAGRRF